jgi:1,5-anhydro-D-fructose reductase (1,5-anhydro-D-mannitol-forming)
MGRVHAAAWKARDDSRVVAVFDLDRERAGALAAETGARFSDSWQAAIETDGVSVVSVCTPICFHAEMTVHAANCGRHVLTEKAIALTLEDADRMIEAAAAAGVKLAVGYQHRTLPRHRTWRALIERGVLSGPLLVRFEDTRGVRPKTAMHRRGMNGGPVIDMAGHHVDMVRYYTGAEPVRISACGHCFGASKPELRAFDDLAIDAAEILVEYEGGHVLSACVHWGLPAGHPGRSEMSIRTADAVSVPAGDRISVRYADREVRYDPVPGVTGTAGRVADLVNAITANERPEVAGEDGRIALAACLAALESIETGRTVNLPQTT